MDSQNSCPSLHGPASLALLMLLNIVPMANGGANGRRRYFPTRRQTMAMAIIFAGCAFWSTANPPGGVWRRDCYVDVNGKDLEFPRVAGQSIMGYVSPGYFAIFTTLNTTAFVTAITVFLLLLCGVSMEGYWWRWMTIQSMLCVLVAVLMGSFWQTRLLI